MQTISPENPSVNLLAMQRLIRVLNSGTSRNQVLKELLKEIRGVVPAQNIALFEVDPDDLEQMYLAASVKEQQSRGFRVVLSTMSKLGKGITAWCASQKTPGKLNSEGLKENAYHSKSVPIHLGGQPLHNILWVPLLSDEGAFLGLLKCENKLDKQGKPASRASFTDEDLRLATEFQPLLTLALLWPYPQSARRLEARNVARRIAMRQLRENNNPSQTFQLVIASAVKIIKADRGDLAWWKGKQHALVYAAVENGAPDCASIKPGSIVHENSFMRAVFQDLENDHSVDGKVHLRTENYIKADERVRSELAVRIDLHGNPAGVINIESFKESYFDDEHVETLRDLAQAASIAIQNAQFNQLLQRALIYPPTKPETRLQPILEGILETLGYDAGLVYRHEPSWNWLRVAAYVAAPDIEAVPADFKHKLDKPSFARQVFELTRKNGQDDWLTCLDPRGETSVDQEALKVWKIQGPLFGFPLRFRGKPVGCIVLWTIDRPAPRHQQAERYVRIFQRLAAARIHLWNINAELLEKKVFFEALSGSFMIFTKREESAWGENDRPQEVSASQPRIVFEWANEQFLTHVGKEILDRKGSLEGLTDWDIFKSEAAEYYRDDLKTLGYHETGKQQPRVDGKLERHTRPRDNADMQVRVWKTCFTGADKKRRILVFFWDRTDTYKIELENQLWSDDFFHRVSSCFRQISHLLPGQRGTSGQETLAAGALEKINASIQYTDRLVRLLYERSGKDEVEIKPFFTEATELVSNIYRSAKNSNVTLQSEFCEGTFPWSKARACVRVLVELLSNSYLWAADSTSVGGSFQIRCVLKHVDGGHELTISDNGHPLTQAVLREAEPHKGLGIVKRLVTDSLGGRIDYQETAGDGCGPGNTFRLYLPDSRQPAPPLNVSEDGHSPHILFVDDDADDAAIYIQALRREGYRVTGPVATLKEAHEILAAGRVSLIVLDISLGDKPTAGIELAKEIRKKMQPGSTMPIIFFTKHSAGHRWVDEAKRIEGSFVLVKHANRVAEDLVLTVYSRLRDRISGNVLFVCYSHNQKEIMNKLHMHLKAQQIEQALEIKLWVDTEIPSGDDWFERIKQALDASIAAVLLVDVDFMNSAFIQHHELPALLNRERSKNKSIFPIMASQTGTKLNGDGDLRMLNFMAETEQRPLDTLTPAELSQKLAEIAGKIRTDLGWHIGKRGI
ncbi:MAG TPA: hypothetical protein DIT64_13840 [Verrucomicrobiales bacterium]|nr:hypothetical protein [Verrucomicrobiales bacterium]